MKKLIFLCISAALVIFTVIVLNISPVIHNEVSSWEDETCDYYADQYSYSKERTLAQIQGSSTGVSDEDDKEEYLDLLKEQRDRCYRHKAMEGLEYSSLNINILFGFTCVLLGLFNYLNAGNKIDKIISLIGLVSGIIGFVLTFVYIIYSGIIFTQEVVGKKYTSLTTRYSTAIPKANSDGTFLEWDEDKKSYVCIFYEKDNKDSVYAKYSDYGKKYLNYYKKLQYATDDKNYEIIECKQSSSFIVTVSSGTSPGELWNKCRLLNEKKGKFSDLSEDSKEIPFIYSDENGKKLGDCQKLRLSDQSYTNNANKNKYDHWATSIGLCCIISVINIGLAIFGFLLFKDSNGQGDATPISTK